MSRSKNTMTPKLWFLSHVIVYISLISCATLKRNVGKYLLVFAVSQMRWSTSSVAYITYWYNMAALTCTKVQLSHLAVGSVSCTVWLVNVLPVPAREYSVERQGERQEQVGKDFHRESKHAQIGQPGVQQNWNTCDKGYNHIFPDTAIKKKVVIPAGDCDIIYQPITCLFCLYSSWI